MATSFSVDAYELRTIALHCFTLRGQLDEKVLPRDELQGISGDDRVEDAYGAFVRHWSDGLAKAQGHIETLALRLSDAADGYCTTENAVERAAGGAPNRKGNEAAPSDSSR